MHKHTAVLTLITFNACNAMFNALNISLESVGLNFSPTYYGAKTLLLNRSVWTFAFGQLSYNCALERSLPICHLLVAQEGRLQQVPMQTQH